MASGTSRGWWFFSSPEGLASFPQMLKQDFHPSNGLLRRPHQEPALQQRTCSSLFQLPISPLQVIPAAPQGPPLRPLQAAPGPPLAVGQGACSLLSCPGPLWPLCCRVMALWHGGDVAPLAQPCPPPLGLRRGDFGSCRLEESPSVTRNIGWDEQCQQTTMEIRLWKTSGQRWHWCGGKVGHCHTQNIWILAQSTARQRMTLANCKNRPVLLPPSQPLVALKPSCTASLLNTASRRVYTGDKMRLSHRVEPESSSVTFTFLRVICLLHFVGRCQDLI